MNNVPNSILKSIRKDKEIEMDGLVFYPILVDEIEEFNQARVAIEFMQQRLPAKYVSMPILSAYYAYDYDLLTTTGEASGLFYSAVFFLCLALRIGKGEDADKRVGRIQIISDAKDRSKLDHLRFLYNGEQIVKIAPYQFSLWRPILAEQNGLEIPDEAADLDLLEAKDVLSSAGAPTLNINTDDMLTSIAMICGCDESEMMEWTVRKLFRRRNAANRILHFMVTGIGEMSGNIKWKNGNPYPSWCFDKKDESSALISMSGFVDNLGNTASERTQ